MSFRLVAVADTVLLVGQCAVTRYYGNTFFIWKGEGREGRREERERERERERQTDRQTERQRDRQRDRETETERQRETERSREKQRQRAETHTRTRYNLHVQYTTGKTGIKRLHSVVNIQRVVFCRR